MEWGDDFGVDLFERFNFGVGSPFMGGFVGGFDVNTDDVGRGKGFNRCLALGGVVEDLGESGGNNINRWNAGSAGDCERSAAKRGCGEPDVGCSGLANLHQSRFGAAGGKFVRREGCEQNFSRLSPKIVDNHVKTSFRILPAKVCT